MSVFEWMLRQALGCDSVLVEVGPYGAVAEHNGLVAVFEIPLDITLTNDDWTVLARRAASAFSEGGCALDCLVRSLSGG